MKTVEQLAREAGIEFDDELEPQPIWYVDKRDLQRFHDLAIAQYRESLLAGVGEPEHICTLHTPEYVGYYTADQMAAAVAIERERCAKVCDGLQLARTCAAAIRGQA